MKMKKAYHNTILTKMKWEFIFQISQMYLNKYQSEAHVYVYSGSKYEYLEANSATMIY